MNTGSPLAADPPRTAAGSDAPPTQAAATPHESVARRDRQKARARRAFWLKQVYSWHWISSAICLVAILLFSVTGITLNHAADIPAEPVVTEIEAVLPPALVHRLAEAPLSEDAPLPADVAEWLSAEHGIAAAGHAGEWSAQEVYVALPRPGGDAWLSIDRASGDMLHERTDRGWIAYLNDLHKGRHTGPVWYWFIDVFATACLVFSGTGLVLLQTHATKRPATWPVVGAGLLVPVFIAMFFIH